MNNNEVWPKIVGLIAVWIILYFYMRRPKK